MVTFFSPLIEKLKRWRVASCGLSQKHDDRCDRRQRDAYWHWFADHWHVNKAVQVVEDVIGAGGRPRRIAYRMIFGSGETVRLDVSPRGDYEPGVQCGVEATVKIAKADLIPSDSLVGARSADRVAAAGPAADRPQDFRGGRRPVQAIDRPHAEGPLCLPDGALRRSPVAAVDRELR